MLRIYTCMYSYMNDLP